jgi:hypothetical protein
VDCSYKYGSLQFRINAFLDNDGLTAAIRALGNDIPTPEKIGFPNTCWQDIVRRKQGLCLFTGITGAGKSTTIASLIQRINENRACRIITLEDPIEYIFPQRNSMISQRELGRDVDDFTRGLRSMMREDPDVIFVAKCATPPRLARSDRRRNRPPRLLHPPHPRRHRNPDPHPRLLPLRCARMKSATSFRSDCDTSSARNSPPKRRQRPRRRHGNPQQQLRRRQPHPKRQNEQIYSQMQVKTKNQPDGKMITFERHLAILVKRASSISSKPRNGSATSRASRTPQNRSRSR